MSSTFMICVTDFRDLCPRLSPCIGLNSIRATQIGLSQTCHGFCGKHLDMSRWFVSRLSWFVSATFIKTSWFHDLSPFVSATFMICVHDFPRGEVSVIVGIMEFGLKQDWCWWYLRIWCWMKQVQQLRWWWSEYDESPDDDLPVTSHCPTWPLNSAWPLVAAAWFLTWCSQAGDADGCDKRTSDCQMLLLLILLTLPA